MSNVTDYAEWAAKWHDEWAKNYRFAAQKIRDEWTGSDFSAEDNRANYADARDHDRKAGDHECNAQAFRAMKPTSIPVGQVRTP